ncbi:Rha family transcriptional regulator [Paenibacillus prosopidis]|uniref:Anti-repressor protein n=1 Tax=Paenibacillus prosopidis TaxID=630520 RepID=A0A368VVU6_9BACL|nr:Rha family transcriptional regulator [Paenibacillus prosopidis]RCW44265.1 anti-repressor protein [Paenibacillus prosopidis]
MKLVFIENNRPVTDSLTVAETFGKRHADVMRDIRNLECSEEFNQRNFAQINYQDEMNRSYPKYLITQDGFSFLVMGYTGKDAARFKEMYIGEFNRMRDGLNNDIEKFLYNPDTIIQIAQNWKEEKQLRLQAEAKIESDRPLVLYAESMQVSKDAILINDMAKLLKQNGIDIGEKRLFQYLRDEGYLIKGGSEYNMPTQRSMNLGIMEIKLGQRSSASEGVKMTRTTKITGKGQIYFINKFLKKESA